MKTTNERYHVPVLIRALEVIDALTQQGREGATLTEIKELLEYSKNSIFRITTTLLDLGYLSRHPESQKFTLTKKFLSFGLHAITDDNIIEQSMDILRELRDATHTSSFLGVISGGKGVLLAQVPGGYPFQLSIEPGANFRMHCSAPAKSLLAFMSEQETEPILKKIQFTQFTDNTITTLRAFRKELEKIRETGYAIDNAEEFEGVHCIGAPVFDHTNQAIATLWVSATGGIIPCEDFPRIGKLVKQSAFRISDRLGYHHDQAPSS